jgi:uncharacterized membrane protein YjgN (DUF898 family)
MFPWILWNLKSYQHSHYRFSTESTRFKVKARSYFLLSLKSFGVMLLMYVVLIVASMLIFGAAVAANGPPVMPKSPMDYMVWGLAGMVIGALVFPAIKLYPIVRFQNLVWSGTRSEKISFTSTLRFWDMAGLTLKNWLFMLLTLGLYWPFAAVALTRMRLVVVQLESSVSPAALLADRQSVEGAAIGDAAGDFFGFDIGL